MNRRHFLGFLGVVPLAAVGPVKTKPAELCEITNSFCTDANGTDWAEVERRLHDELFRLATQPITPKSGKMVPLGQAIADAKSHNAVV